MTLIKLEHVDRYFPIGKEKNFILNDINIEISEGEFVAIVGPSGGGKSSLLNILGCLDKPSSGKYYFKGGSIDELSSDEISLLRRDWFGFIFQRYNLLSEFSALENVTMPAVYAGEDPKSATVRAIKILRYFGLATRIKYKPNQMSGGQQQRVSIARSLINGARVIFADEPTGALDSDSSNNLLKYLSLLNKQGITIVLVTHNPEVAAISSRLIYLQDGRITEDKILQKKTVTNEYSNQSRKNKNSIFLYSRLIFFISIINLAIRSVLHNRLRTLLTILGIFIGTFAVVLSISIAQSAREAIKNTAGTLATSALRISRGTDWADSHANSITSMRTVDLIAIRAESYVKNVVPILEQETKLRYKHRDFSARLIGIDPSEEQTGNFKLLAGREITRRNVEQADNVVVINDHVRNKLFEKYNAVGSTILISDIPFLVIGVVKNKDGSDAGAVWVSISSALQRIQGKKYFDGYSVYLNDLVSAKDAEKYLEKLLIRMHGRKDFYIRNMAAYWEQTSNMIAQASLALGLIAAISLVVGGIGVMNIMLVSVSERTREIGLRLAVGARQSDIRQQFLVEAIILCLIGGIAGVVVAQIACFAISISQSYLSPVISLTGIVSALATCVSIGLTFGYLPARAASGMDPAIALTSD